MAKYAKKKNRSGGKEPDLEQTYHGLTGGRKKKPKKAPVIPILISAAVLLFALAGGIWFLRLSPQLNEQILPGVTAAGVDLSGLTQREAADALEAATENTYSQKSMVIQVLDTTVTLTPAEVSPYLDVKALAAAAMDAGLSQPRQMDISPYLSLDTDAIRAAVSQLSQQYNQEMVQSDYTLEEKALTVTLGKPGYQLDEEALYRQILAAYGANTFQVTGSCTELTPEPLDLEAILKECAVEPVDASMDPDTFAVIDGTDGLTFDLEAAKAAIAQAQPGDTLEIPLKAVPPQVTGDSLRDTLFRDTLASYRTAYSGWQTERNTNLRLACEAINGTVLMPGESFSFNDTLGERTADKGYQGAPAYAGGEVVTSLGGGICQVASTLYYCTLLSDMEILERDCHMFAASYLPLGMDATIAWGYIDFRFRNTTEYPLRIEAFTEDDHVNVRLIGTDTKSYYVEMEYEIIEVYEGDTVYEEYPPDNDEGYEDGDVISSAVTGYYVKTYRCKYDKETDEQISRSYEDDSEYEYRDTVICRIPAQETEPTDPDLSGGGVSEDGGDQ